MKICSTLLMMIIIEVLCTPTFTIRSLRAKRTMATRTTTKPSPSPLPSPLPPSSPTTTIQSKNITKNNVIIHHVDGDTEMIGHRIKTPSIVIQTQQRNYEEPTLKEYEECQVKLRKCQILCSINSNRTACELYKCPICPILIDNNILIQGVNDTNDSDMIELKQHNRNQNITNIIRLTNDIHNIIDNHLGNVTHNNLNNVNIQQNISSLMANGKYGFGYDNDGQSCCLLLQNRQCNRNNNHKHDYQYHNYHNNYNHHHHHHRHHHHHSHHHHHNNNHQLNLNGCRYKHERVCGKKCTARIIQVRKVKICERDINDNVNELDFIENNNCHIALKYIPYQPGQYKRSIQHYARHVTTKCHFQSYWPYVHCSKIYNYRNSWSNICGYCYDYPYGHLLHYGLPQHCHKCFNHLSYATLYRPPFMWPTLNDFNYNDYNYYDVNTDYNYDMEAKADAKTDAKTDADMIIENWLINKTICKLEDGTLSDECIEFIWNNNENQSTTKNPLMPVGRGNNYNDDKANNHENHNNNNDNNDDDNYDDNMDDYIDINDVKDDDVKVDKPEHHYLFKRSKYSLRYRN